jgi:hypothetical protein
MTARTFAFERPRRDATLAAAVVGSAALVGGLSAFEPLLTLAALAVGVTALAMVAKPNAAVYVVVALIYLNVPALAVKLYGLPRNAAALVPLLLAFPVAVALVRGRRLRLDATLMMLLGLLGVEVVATMLSAHKELALDNTITFVVEGIVVYFLLVHAVTDAATLRRAAWVVLGAAAALSAVPLFQAITGAWTDSLGGFGQINAGYLRNPEGTPRASGPLGDPNYFAQVLLPALAIGLVAFRGHARGARRWLTFALTAFVAIGLLLTYSRGAVVAFLLLVGALVALRYAKASHVLLAAAVVTGLILAMPEYGARVMTLSSIAGATAEEGSSTEADVSTRGRAGEMAAAVHAFADHPLVGVGPGVFPLHYQAYAKRLGIDLHSTSHAEARIGEEPPRQAHSLVLATAADLGLTGLALFGGLFAVLLRALLRVHRRTRGDDPALSHLAAALFLALTAYLAAGLFLSLAFQRYLWLLVALAGAAVRVAAHEPKKSASRAS